MSDKSILDLATEHTRACDQAARSADKPVFGTGNFKKKVVSETLAVHPDQIPEAIEESRKLGVPPPNFDQHGRPTFDNSSHFRRYAKAHGYRHYGY